MRVNIGGDSSTVKCPFLCIYRFFLLQYGIVIDAGSSRSNLYVYEWPGEKENETGVVSQSLNCKVDGESLSGV